MILVSNKERERFPFDIQHRAVITYTTESSSDFEKLQNAITARAKALIEMSTELATVSTPISPGADGLSAHEMAALVIVASESFGAEDHISVSYLKSQMSIAGFTDTATVIAVRLLETRRLIARGDYHDRNDRYSGYATTRAGDDWLMNNQDKLVLRKPRHDDIPF